MKIKYLLNGCSLYGSGFDINRIHIVKIMSLLSYGNHTKILIQRAFKNIKPIDGRFGQ